MKPEQPWARQNREPVRPQVRWRWRATIAAGRAGVWTLETVVETDEVGEPLQYHLPVGTLPSLDVGAHGHAVAKSAARIGEFDRNDIGVFQEFFPPGLRIGNSRDVAAAV